MLLSRARAHCRCCVVSSATVMDERLLKFWTGKPRVILGSESYSRRALMDELASKYNFNYETAKAAIDEAAIGCRASDPRKLVALLAHAKAKAIRDRLESANEGYLLTCDQVVVHDNQILEKPRDAEEARRFIRGYGESPGKTVGSVVCTDLSSGRTFEGVDEAEVHFKAIPEAVIDELVEEGLIFRCAGGLMIEHPLVTPLITSIQGTEDSVKGLPKQLVLELLLQAAGM